MGHCVRCGHQLGIGRFCTNCGQLVDAPTPGDPLAPRYPLFADEVAPVHEVHEVEPVELAPDPTRRPPRVWWPWVAVLVALALVVVLLLVALGWTADDGRRPEGDDPAGAAAVPAGEPQEVAGDASVVVPATAPPNQDTEGNPTTYEAANLVDGRPATAWRMPGDGTGEQVTVTLPGETRLTRVGLINGYAKSAGDLDWYAGNRRVLAVEWAFDDGTTVEQELTETRDLQTVDVDVTTTTVVLRLVAVSAPGSGPSSRDFTAISELSLAGPP